MACLALAWCRCGAARQAAPGGPVRIDSLCVRIFFERDLTDYNPIYRSNAVRIDSFVQRFRLLRADTLCSIRDIEVVSSASPEGSHSRNLRLSQQRANVLIGLLEKRVTLNDLNLNVRSIGSDWAALERMVEADTHMPRRDEVLRIIRHTPPLVYDDRRNIVSSRVKQLMDLDGGRVWWYMDEKFFPDLRQSGVRVVCRFERQDTPSAVEEPAAPVVPALPVIPPAPEVPDIQPEPAQADTLWLSIVPVAMPPVAGLDGGGSGRRDTVVVVHKDTVYIKQQVDTLLLQAIRRLNDMGLMEADETTIAIAPRQGGFKNDSLFKTPEFALRTNLLVPLMNVGIEMPLSNRWSVEADIYSPWITRDLVDKVMPSHKGCIQALGGTAALRYWLGKRHDNKTGDPRYRLCGHSIGFVAFGGMYDVEWDWEGQQGEFACLGLDYLYALPLGKGGAHFEFNIGVGGGINWYNKYNVYYDGGKLMNNGGRQHRLVAVPIRVGFSLVMPFGKRSKTEAAEGLDR